MQEVTNVMVGSGHDAPSHKHQLAGVIEEHMAQANYRFKVQAKQFQDAFDRMQSVWRSAGQKNPIRLSS